MKSPNHNVFDFLFEAGLALMVTALTIGIFIVGANLVLSTVGAPQLSMTANQLALGAATICLFLTLIFFCLAIYKS